MKPNDFKIANGFLSSITFRLNALNDRCLTSSTSHKLAIKGDGKGSLCSLQGKLTFTLSKLNLEYYLFDTNPLRHSH